MNDETSGAQRRARLLSTDHLLSCRDVLPLTVLTAGAFWEMLRRSRTASGS